MIDIITELSKLLDEIDTFDEAIPTMQQQLDYKISDMYHYLENNSINSKMAYRFCKELKSILLERRKFKNNCEIVRTFKNELGKITSNINNRKIGMNAIYKTQKQFDSKYNNRIYTEEELKEKLEG